MSDSIKIAVIGGDGTGPEGTAEACKVLEAVAPLDGISYERVDFDYGGERYLATGEVITEQQIDELRQFDAAHARAQDQRADLRGQPVGARLPRDGT